MQKLKMPMGVRVLSDGSVFSFLILIF